MVPAISAVQSPMFASRTAAHKPPAPAFGNSDALKLMEEGNPQQAIVNLVEDLKGAAARSYPDLYEVARIHTFIAKAFERRLSQILPTGNQDEIKDAMWKLNVHALEAERLWSIVGRSDWRGDVPKDGVMPSTEDNKAWAQRELQEWFKQEGLTYLSEAPGHFCQQA